MADLEHTVGSSANGILRGFEDRAKDFLRDIERGEGFITIYREYGRTVSHYGLQVGVGKHEGLVFKNGHVSDAQLASMFYDKLMEHFRQRGYGPNSYELVKPNYIAVGKRIGVVQDYFTGPSLSELRNYLVMGKEIKKRGRKLKRGLNTDEMRIFRHKFMANEDSGLRCEHFLNQQCGAGITLEQIDGLKENLTLTRTI